jgi:hypothetical protein
MSSESASGEQSERLRLKRGPKRPSEASGGGAPRAVKKEAEELDV